MDAHEIEHVRCPFLVMPYTLLYIYIDKMRDVRDYNLLGNNTFGIDARCSRFVEYTSVEEAQQIARNLTDADMPLLIIGGGSNLLLTKDYQGTVLHSAIKGIEVAECDENAVVLRCGSGEVFDDVVAYCVEKGYHGMENLSLIPGEVGASAVQNIGAYGAEAKDVICRVEAVEIATGKVVEFANADCDYSYRQSRFKKEWKDKYLITYVDYKLSLTFSPSLDYGNVRNYLKEKNILHPTALQLREAIIEIRKAKLPDPKEQGNAGSFFMNPIVTKQKYDQLVAEYPNMPHYTIDAAHEKIPAGWMIEQCGWKGKSLGRAGVHDKQALVLVNKGGATGDEIVKLCETVRNDVKLRFGIDIHPEVNIK